MASQTAAEGRYANSAVRRTVRSRAMLIARMMLQAPHERPLNVQKFPKTSIAKPERETMCGLRNFVLKLTACSKALGPLGMLRHFGACA